MSETFKWCKDKSRLAIWDKQVFCIDECGDKCWYLNGKKHRVDGPAIECANGNKVWCLNDKLHRENGPAVEYANGTKEWYLNGKRHRVDGPAFEFANGDKWWCLNGRQYSESDYWKELKK